MRVSTGVEMLELEVEAFGDKAVLNPTLIWDENSAILIDTGFPGKTASLREALAEVGVSFDKLKAVILTHQDLDHIGCITDILRETQGQVKVYAHKEDKPYIEGSLPLIKTNPKAMEQVLAVMPEEQRSKALALFENPPKAQIDMTLEDGQVLPDFGGIQVIYTPGHTPGHISLYLKESKTLIAADSMMYIEGRLIGPVPQTTLDMHAANQSLEKFLDLDIEKVICYHGGLCSENVMEQIKAIVEQTKVTEEK